jgi:membrane AbrB-like protein
MTSTLPHEIQGRWPHVCAVRYRPAPMPVLLIVTAALVAVLYVSGVPAAFLLGALGAAMIVVGRGGAVRLPGWIFALAQAVVGCLIARSFTPALFGAVGQHFALFAGVTFSVLLVATALGLVLARLRVLPGSTALWGAFPGAATVMVLLSGSFGGDMRLVAVMQYLRVVVVAVTASLVGRLFGLGGGGVRHPAWLAPVAWPSFAACVAIILFSGLVGPRLKRFPAAPLLLPMVIATLLQDVGWIRVDLPQPLLVASYLVVGWAIGLRFTRESFREAGHALPKMLAGIVALVVACSGIGWALTRVAHIDMLTAYFATSPGGADSIAIIAAGTSVDIPFVMATQMSRFVAVLVLGPALAKRASRLTPPFPHP